MVVEVEILEVNRHALKEYGIEITSGIDVQASQGIAGADRSPNPDPVDPNTLDDNPYARSNLVITSLPGVIYRLLKTDTSTRLLANPSCAPPKARPRRPASATRCRCRSPPSRPIATGGVAQQPVTSFEYKNVGVNIDITPRVHHDGEVTLG